MDRDEEILEKASVIHIAKKVTRNMVWVRVRCVSLDR